MLVRVSEKLMFAKVGSVLVILPKLNVLVIFEELIKDGSYLYARTSEPRETLKYFGVVPSWRTLMRIRGLKNQVNMPYLQMRTQLVGSESVTTDVYF